MKQLNKFKLFHTNSVLLESDLEKIEQLHNFHLREAKKQKTDKDETFYPQFPSEIRSKAKEMATHYEIFYCLENYIRDLVAERLLAVHGDKWWSTNVPDGVKGNVQNNIQKELDAGVTVRSSEQIDYTTFGELSVIIECNWDTFSDTFNSKKGLTAVLSKLNLLRAPIAHCSALTEDEVLRLKLSLRDWFRLME